MGVCVSVGGVVSFKLWWWVGGFILGNWAYLMLQMRPLTDLYWWPSTRCKAQRIDFNPKPSEHFLLNYYYMHIHISQNYFSTSQFPNRDYPEHHTRDITHERTFCFCACFCFSPPTHRRLILPLSHILVSPLWYRPLWPRECTHTHKIPPSFRRIRCNNTFEWWLMLYTKIIGYQIFRLRPPLLWGGSLSEIILIRSSNHFTSYILTESTDAADGRPQGPMSHNKPITPWTIRSPRVKNREKK